MANEAANSWLSDYQSVEHVGPDADMSPKLYAAFLEGKGVTVMVIVDRLREEFALTMAEAWDVVHRALAPHGPAHMREVELIENLRSYPDDFALARKIGGNLGLDQAAARELVAAYRAGVS